MKIRQSLPAAFAAALLAALPASAQQTTRTSTDLSSTIAVTDTFQSINAANPARQGCTIQNNGAATMWVFFGAIAGATKAKSVVLTTGQSVRCNLPGVTLGDQISITGTATQEFYAKVQ